MKLKELHPGETFRVKGDIKYQYLGTKVFRAEILYLYRFAFKIKGFFTDNGDTEVFICN
ncbi:MAG: hypothetical protein LBN27_03575 [Prevotellaceae bacterium]|nr:hypothetical protein [Prevotellaceae bacterium]